MLVGATALLTLSVAPSQGPLAAQYAQDTSLLNPVVTSNLTKHFIINFKPLRTELEALQKRYPYKTYIYFSYLNNASWVGLHERDEFVAASTIKVPVAMSLLKAVEEKKLSLDDDYSLEELDLDANFGDLYKAGPGEDVTVGELLKIMLEQSDNTALNGLVSVFSRIGIDDPLYGVFGFLGWEFTQAIPEIGEVPDYSKINLKTLANIFLSLYDAKYVNIEHSNLILTYLANTPFDTRIVAGVPEDVRVAHKIGTASADNTYSDCGIVYAPNRHYLLCVGAMGGSERDADSFIAEVSRAVYEYVINN